MSPAGRSAAAEPAALERFDPGEDSGKLIDSEHRGRYWWAAQIVEGMEVLDAGCGLGYGTEILAAAGARRVVGADLDEPTVAEARARFPALAESFLCADLCRLELPEESFDVVVCFETIQQVADGERVLGELRRVLRPGGLLLISSPSPDVYAGNEHHRHEYRQSELSAVVEERFANVASYRQHPWLASAIEPLGEDAEGRFSQRLPIRASRLDPGAATYTILAASDAELPRLGGLLALGSDFEVRWWAERVQAAEREATERLAAEGARARAQARRAVDELRRDLATARSRERIAEERMRESSEALLQANQQLAALPTLRHRHEELKTLRAQVEVLEGSRSWRYMASLRWLWRKLRLGAADGAR